MTERQDAGNAGETSRPVMGKIQVAGKQGLMNIEP